MKAGNVNPNGGEDLSMSPGPEEWQKRRLDVDGNVRGYEAEVAETLGLLPMHFIMEPHTLPRRRLPGIV